jgi:hypothetical protein
MERLEECADAVGVLVDERIAADHAVADEERAPRDVLERGDFHRQCRSERRQQRDLDLERLLDGRATRKTEHQDVVDDHHLEVVPVVDLENRLRASSQRVRDQPVAVGGHSLIIPHVGLPGRGCRRVDAPTRRPGTVRSRG